MNEIIVAATRMPFGADRADWAVFRDRRRSLYGALLTLDGNALDEVH